MSKKNHDKLEVVNLVLQLLIVAFNCVMIVIYPNHDLNIVAAIIGVMAATMSFTDICIQSALETRRDEDAIE